MKACLALLCIALCSSPSLAALKFVKYDRPPFITNWYEDTGWGLLIQVGKPFLIPCNAIGQPLPTFRWTKNGEPFNWTTYGSRIRQIDGEGSLEFTYASDEDVGAYQCFAENRAGAGTTISVFVRKMELKPFEDKDPTTVKVDEGISFHLTCEAPEGYPKPKNGWLKINREALTASWDMNERVTWDPEGTLWFAYLNATEDDSLLTGKDYACYAEIPPQKNLPGIAKVGNPVSLVVNPGESSINLPPKLQYASKNETAVLGTTKQLYCIYGGAPVPTIKWSFNGAPIQSDKIVEDNFGKTLVIGPVTKRHEGEYRCEASNGNGAPQSSSIYLEVKTSPYVYSAIKRHFNVSESSDGMQLFCDSVGVPEPKFAWTYNGKPLIIPETDSRRKLTDNQLKLFPALDDDIGNYGCNVTSPIGFWYLEIIIFRSSNGSLDYH